MQFQFTRSGNGSRGYRWRVDSQRAWPGFPILGTRTTTGPGTTSVYVDIPVPDTTTAGTNTLLFTVYDVDHADLRDSCATSMHGTEAEAVAVNCPAPATWLSGAIIPLAFRITEGSQVGHSYAWRVESARAWPGFPLTGTQAVGGNGSTIVNVGVPVPDSASAGANVFSFIVYDLSDSSRYGSCNTALAAPGSSAATELLAFGSPATLVVNGALDVSFSVPGAGLARLDVHDLRGRRVASRLHEAGQAGSYSLRLAEAGVLRPGMYFVRLTQGGQRVQCRAIVLGAP